MKKIVFLRLNPAATGGAERYLKRLTDELKSNGTNCEIRSLQGFSGLQSWSKALIFNKMSKKMKKSDEIYFSLERISSADIYRAGDGVHKFYRSLKPMWWLNPLNFVYVNLEKKCFKNAKKIITNSEMVKRQIIDFYGISEQKIETIYNGVKIPEKIDKIAAKKALCEEFGLDYALPLVLFVGNGFRRKGVAEFSELLSMCKAQINAIVIGRDKNAEFYQNLSKNLGLKVLFLGQQREVERFYEGSDIFIFPTHYDPFSNVALEAMSYANAVVTTAQNGASEILDEKFVMKNPRDFEILGVLKKLIDDAEFCRSCGEKNRQIAQNFSIEKNAQKTLEIIREIADE